MKDIDMDLEFEEGRLELKQAMDHWISMEIQVLTSL